MPINNKGRKRHIVTDVLGLLLMVHVHAASIQDRNGAPDLLKALSKIISEFASYLCRWWIQASEAEGSDRK